MDYKKKYKEALERARVYHTGGSICDAHMTEVIFPELKESEDEKMKTAIKHVLYENYTDAAVIEGVEIAEIVAWLEDQGKKIDDAYLQGICDAKHEIEKQGEQTHAELGQSKVAKTSDQEPKFHEGDWITTTDEEGNVTTEKIIEFCGDKVRLIDINGFYTLWPEHELNYYHLWTIADAKDGDVLVDSYSKDSILILYKGIDKERSILAHCGWNGYNLFVPSDGLGYGELDNTDYLPATKEQRDLLFQKMKQAGFEWDAEKKELKKIESKKLDAAEVIEWIKNYASLFAANWAILEDVIEQFKRDFGL